MASPTASRGIIGLASSVAAGAVSAGLLAVAFLHPQTMLIFLAYLAAIPLLMAGLGVGIAGALAAGGAGLTGLGFTEPANFVYVYAVIYAVPSVLLTMIALRPETSFKAGTSVEGSLMTTITLYPCLMFLTIFSAVVYGGSDLLDLTTKLLHTAIEPIKNEVDTEKLTQLTAMLDQLAHLLPALIGCSWMFIMMLSLIVAQMGVQQQGWNLRPKFSLQALHIPNWLIIAAALMGVAGVAAPAPYNYLGSNLCFLMCVPFFFVGLAVVHAWASTTKISTLILVIFYITLTVLVWTALLVTVLGVLDQWLNFRRSFAGMKKGGN